MSLPLSMLGIPAAEGTKCCRWKSSSTARAFWRVHKHMGWGGVGDRHIEVLLNIPMLKKPQLETATACSPVGLLGRCSWVYPWGSEPKFLRQQCPKGCSTMQLPCRSKSHLHTGLPTKGLSYGSRSTWKKHQGEGKLKRDRTGATAMPEVRKC